MNEEEQTEFCNNCKKDIPSVNFVMHSSHCSRNITLCEICNEPVRTSEKDEHFQEYHEMVKCDCGNSFEKMNLERHKENDCKCRKVVCEFCELELPFSEMGSHKDYCGNRTELCDKCKKYIKHKDLDDHPKSDCEKESNTLQNNAGASTSQNRLKNPLATMIQNVDFGDDFDHDIDALATLFDNENVHSHNFGLRRDLEPSVVARGANLHQRQARTRHNYNEFDDFQPRVVAQGSNLQQSHARTRDDDDNKDDARLHNQLEEDELIATLLACEQDHNYNHFTEPSLDSIGNQVFEGSSYEHESSNLNEKREADSVLEQTFLPCEFCGEAIKEDDLIQHQSGCQLTSMGAMIPGSFPNLRSLPRSLPPIDFSRDQYDNQAEHNNSTDDHNDTLLPCEFCEELFKSDLLFDHQSMCDPQRTRPSSVVHNEFSFESDPESFISNNSRSRASSRPPRPSRPVMNERLDEEAFEFPSSTESGTLLNGNHGDGYFIPQNRNESYIADLLFDSSDNSYSGARDSHAFSNGSPSNKQTSSSKQGSKKGKVPLSQKENPDFMFGVQDKPSNVNQRSFQRKGSPKTTSARSKESSGSSTRLSGFRNELPKDRKSDRSDRSHYSYGTKSNGASAASTSSQRSAHAVQTDQSVKHRQKNDLTAYCSKPRQDKNRTSNDRKKVVPSKKTEPFEHTKETRQQLSRFTPSTGRPQASSDSRRQDGVQRSHQRKKKIDEDTSQSERVDRRPSAEYKPRTSRKKIA